MYNGQLSTTDRISCRKVAVMEKFDCYSNDDTFIVAINFFCWVKMNEVVPVENLLTRRLFCTRANFTHIYSQLDVIIQLPALMHVMRCGKNSMHSIVAIQFGKRQGKKY